MTTPTLRPGLLQGLRVMAAKVRGLFGRRRRAAELDEEIEFHLAELVATYEQEGLSATEARRAAARRLGMAERVREGVRRERGLPALESFLNDALFGCRMLRRSPLVAALAVGSLGLGLGASSSIFNVIDAVMLSWLPGVHHADELVVLKRREPLGTTTIFSAPEIAALERECPAAAGFAAFTRTDSLQVRLLGNGASGSPDWVNSQLVSARFFATLGVSALEGRLFAGADGGAPGSDSVVVVSDEFRRARFGRDGRAIGHALEINGEPFTIIGVTSPRFHGVEVGLAPSIYLLSDAQYRLHYQGSVSSMNHPNLKAPWSPQSKISWLDVMARLAPASRPEVLAAQASAVARRFAVLNSDPGDVDDERRVRTLRIFTEAGKAGVSALRERSLERSLLILGCGALLLVLIACVNTANLLLARGTARRREIAVRLSQGANRWRVARQLLTESLVLATLGGGLGLLLSAWGSRLLVRLVFGGAELDLSLSLSRFAFVAAIALLTALLCGLAPTLEASRLSLTTSLKEGALSSNPSRGRLRIPFARLLVVTEVALSVVLIVGAGLFVRSLHNLQTVDPGYARHAVLFASLWAPEPAPDLVHTTNTRHALEERLAAVPGVASVSFSTNRLVTDNHRFQSVIVEGRSIPSGTVHCEVLTVTPAFFPTLGIHLVAGRGFTTGDREHGHRVAIVNQNAAGHMLGGAPAVGQHIRFGRNEEPIEVIGVARDVRSSSLRELPPETVYLPAAQTEDMLHDIEIRTSVAPATMMSAVRSVVRSFAPGYLLTDVVTVEDHLDRSLRQDQSLARLTGFFAIVALMLAAGGLYGVIAYGVARRRREIGLRFALGARKGQVLGLVLRETLLLAALGTVIGGVAARFGAQVASEWLFELTPNDPLTLVVAVLVVLACAALAGYAPARRAASVQPLTALRSE
jgi:predicted permease